MKVARLEQRTKRLLEETIKRPDGRLKGTGQGGPSDKGARKRIRDLAVPKAPWSPRCTRPGQADIQLLPAAVAGVHRQLGPLYPLGKLDHVPRVRPLCSPSAVPSTHHPHGDVEEQYSRDTPKGLPL